MAEACLQTVVMLAHTNASSWNFCVQGPVSWPGVSMMGQEAEFAANADAQAHAGVHVCKCIRHMYVCAVFKDHWRAQQTMCTVTSRRHDRTINWHNSTDELSNPEISAQGCVQAPVHAHEAPVRSCSRWLGRTNDQTTFEVGRQMASNAYLV